MSCKTHTTYDEKEKVWHGPKKVVPLFHPDCSVGRVMFKMLKLRPKAVALIFDNDDVSVTNEELLNDSIRIVMQFQELKLSQDDIIGLVAGQTILSTNITLACIFNATAFHPVNPALEQAVLEHLYGITRPKVIFCEGKYYAKVSSACKALKLKAKIYTINSHINGVATVEELMQPNLAEQTYEPIDLQKGGSQTICILNSSGTSGLPKAVCLSNHSLDFSFIELKENQTTFVFSPLDWVSSIFYTIGTICAGAKRVLTLVPYTPEYLVQLIEKHKINNLLIPPSYAACLVQMKGIEHADLSSVRSFKFSGGMMSPTVFTKLHKLLKDERMQILSNCYGVSEFGAIGTINRNMKKPTSVGKIMAGVKIKIVTDDGQHLGVGETGEILLHCGNSWNGYYGNVKETLKMQDEQLWFHSGDLGYFDEDGDLFIVDRKTDIMQYRSMHYSPHEIEKVISVLPDVIEVCVFGNTNETEGDRAAAAIVRCKDSQLTEQQVIQYVAEKFEVEWKRLHGGVYFLESLPKSGNGKIIRRNTKKLALEKVS